MSTTWSSSRKRTLRRLRLINIKPKLPLSDYLKHCEDIVSKHQKLLPIQIQNLKETIRQLEAPLALEELLVEVKEYFDRHPTSDCQDITPRTMVMFLRKFIKIMEKVKDCRISF